jgi:hypothetical protein
MLRFLKAWGRFPRRLFSHVRLLPIFPYFPYFQLRIPPDVGEDELSKELRLDAADEPQEPLPDAEISEKERQEAVRRYQRELKEKGQR